MAFNGSGTYSLPAGNPVVTGTTISSSTTNTTNSDIATALTNCITRDGQSTPSANLPMNAKKLTGLAAGTSAGDSVRYEQIQYINSVASAGTSGQVLTSGGAGAPTWTTPAGSAMTLLSTVTASNSATVDIETTFSSTYDSYLLIATGVIQDAQAGSSLNARLKLGGSYATGANYSYHVANLSSTSTAYSAVSSTGATEIPILPAWSHAADTSGVFSLSISNPTSTTQRKQIYWSGASNSSSSNFKAVFGAGNNTATTALTGIRFLADSGNIGSGTFRLYGISNT